MRNIPTALTGLIASALMIAGHLTAQTGQVTATMGAPDAGLAFDSLLDKVEIVPVGKVTAAKKPKSSKWVFSLLPTSMQRNPLLDFTVITEVTPAGRKLRQPSQRRPIYYIAHTTGPHTEGLVYANESNLRTDQIKQYLVRALASRGYLAADKGRPPTQALFYTWGSHNKTEEEERIDFESDFPGYFNAWPRTVRRDDRANLISRAKLVGGTQFAREFAMAIRGYHGNSNRYSTPLNRLRNRDDMTAMLVDQVFEDCYYLVVSAYDAAALARKERELLWRTHLTVSSQGVSLAQTMPGLIDNGAYFFGRDMKTAEVFTTRPIKEGRVKIGEATVEEYIASPGARENPGAPAASGKHKSGAN